MLSRHHQRSMPLGGPRLAAITASLAIVASSAVPPATLAGPATIARLARELEQGEAQPQVDPPAVSVLRPILPQPGGSEPPQAIPDPAARLRQSAANNAAEGEMTPELNRAVASGLAALARMQRDDGSFGEGAFGGNVAITAIAGIAFMADGHLPGRGPYGTNVAKALEFVLKSTNESGLIASDAANGPMYGHGFATLFLGEVYGMTAGGGETDLASRVHQALVKASRLIQTTQNEEGGWRYNPVPYDADVSVTICQIMALRSARNAGLEIPKATIDKAVEYVRACQNPDGGFRYQMSSGPSLWPRSAAGVASLQYAGIYEDKAIEQGLKYLFATALPGRAGANQQLHYFYGHYYAVQAMFLAGGEAWAGWWPAVREELLERQRADGTWEDPSVGDAYGTAMALIVLQMPKRYLPIFQK